MDDGVYRAQQRCRWPLPGTVSWAQFCKLSMVRLVLSSAALYAPTRLMPSTSPHRCFLG